ncbi:MAG: YraN family protein [Methylococcales bacterium]|nr:YraN family protein [Methylococcales bacterium]
MFSNPRPSHLLSGDRSEQAAYHYLIQQGLLLIEKNYRCKHGELDLIMRDGKTLVVVEVRFRNSNKYGSAEESITQAKQSRIIATTQHYLQLSKINSAIRFDVIAISKDDNINWIKNAF